MNEIEKNKINKSDNKDKIAEKINNCNSICIDNLNKYKEIFDKLSELKNIEENIPVIKEFFEEYLSSENSINKIEEIKQYYSELFEERENNKLSIKNNIEDTEDKLNELYDKIFINKDENQKTIENKLSNILELYNKIIENEDSIKNKIENYNNEIFPNIQKEIEENENQIKKYKQELIGTSENDKNSIKYEIQNFYDKIKEYNEEVFFDSENGKKSIKTEINNLIKKIEQAEIEREKIYKNTKEELESLLPYAGGIGLSYDYNKAKQDYGLIFKNDKSTQKLAILKTFLFSYLFQYLIFLIPLSFIVCLNYQVISNLVKNKLSYFPIENILFVAPLFWISFFGNRNITLRKKMYEEYNHKEKVLKMFSSLKDELKNNEDKVKYYDEEGREKELTQYQRLIEIVLDTVEYNPSKILGVKEENFLTRWLGIKELKLKLNKNSGLELKSLEKNPEENYGNKNDNL